MRCEGPLTSVCNIYFAAKENIFLNTRVNNANFLEKTGNLFLTPIHYLCNGRSITLLKTEGGKIECAEEQTYNYKEMHMRLLRAALAIILLIPALLLGSLFKGLSYLSSLTRENHHQIAERRNTEEIVPSEEIYKNMGLLGRKGTTKDLVSEEVITHQKLSRPENCLSEKQKTEIEGLKEIAGLLEGKNIPFWLECGTCLGAYRHGGMIPWDHDIDIGIIEADHDNVKKALNALDKKKYLLQDWSSDNYPRTFLRVLVKKTRNYIDIEHYKLDPDNRTGRYFFTFQDSTSHISSNLKKREFRQMNPLNYSTIFPLKQAYFEDKLYPVANDTVAFLESKYDGVLTPCKIWDEKKQAYVDQETHLYVQLNNAKILPVA